MFFTSEVSTMQHVTDKAFSKCEMNVTVLQIFHSFQCKSLFIVKSLILLGDKNHKTRSNLLNLNLDGWVWGGEGWQDISPVVGIQASASHGGNHVA